MTTAQLLLTAAEVELVAAEGAKPRRLRIVAYAGGEMSPAGFANIVIDLAGMSLPSSLPILSDHENTLTSIIASGTPTIEAGKLIVTATLANSPAADHVKALLASGVALQASVGASPTQRRQLREKENVNVNGRTITAGPHGLTVIEKSVLKEVSLTPLGADSDTSVSIAAARKKAPAMTATIEPKLRVFILEMGGNPDNISPAQLLKAQASFDGGPYVAAIDDNSPEGEGRRIDAINAIVATGDVGVMLKAKGLANNWTSTETELAILRASMPQAHTVFGGSNGGNGPQALTASLMVKAGYATAAEKTFGPQVMEQSRRLHGQSLPDLCRAALLIDGRDVPMERGEMIRAALSTGSMPVALGDSANKILFEAYKQAPASWRSFASVRAAANFKTQHGLRPSFGGDLKELGIGGEIKHGTFAEEDFQWRVDTFAKQFSIDRRDIVNDDASVFSDVIPGLARAAARTLNSLVATTLLANAGTFFGSTNANYFEGAATTLSATSLATAIKMLRQMKDAEGNLLDLQPAVLLVPPELEQVARALIMSSEVSRDTSLDQLPTGNTMKDVAALAVEPRLSDSTFSGNSAVAWFLFSDAVNSAVTVGFLDGMQSPVLESFGLDHDVNKLAYSMRVYHDFGAALADPRAAIKSKGAA